MFIVTTVHSNGKPSYREVFTNNKANLKVSYFPRDHSAITTSNPRYLISKWAWGPLVKHAISQCPFYKNAQIKYYESIFSYSISGPSTVCEEATYSIENLPAGASVEWSVEKPNLAKIDNNGRIRFVSGQSGNTDIIANISLANNNIEIRKRIAIGHPEFVIDCIADLGNGRAVFFASPKNNYGFTSSYFNYHWWYSDEYGNNFTTVGNYYNETFVNIQPVIDFPSRGTYIISMSVSGTDCDIPLAKTTYKVLDKNNFFSLYPNPASSVVNLELNESEQAEAQATERRVNRTTEKGLYEIQLWNSTGILKTIKSTQSKVQIPLNGLPKGLYYVLVIKDGKTERQKLVVE